MCCLLHSAKTSSCWQQAQWTGQLQVRVLDVRAQPWCVQLVVLPADKSHEQCSKLAANTASRPAAAAASLGQLQTDTVWQTQTPGNLPTHWDSETAMHRPWLPALCLLHVLLFVCLQCGTWLRAAGCYTWQVSRATRNLSGAWHSLQVGWHAHARPGQGLWLVLSVAGGTRWQSMALISWFFWGGGVEMGTQGQLKGNGGIVMRCDHKPLLCTPKLPEGRNLCPCPLLLPCPQQPPSVAVPLSQTPSCC